MVVMLVISMAAVVWIITSRNAGDARTTGFAYADEVAQRNAARADLRAVLVAHPEFLGVWSGWEPDAFDKNDSEFRKADAGYDATGRFMPYWFRDGDKISLTPLTDYDKS